MPLWQTPGLSLQDILARLISGYLSGVQIRQEIERRRRLEEEEERARREREEARRLALAERQQRVLAEAAEIYRRNVEAGKSPDEARDAAVRYATTMLQGLGLPVPPNVEQAILQLGAATPIEPVRKVEDFAPEGVRPFLPPTVRSLRVKSQEEALEVVDRWATSVINTLSKLDRLTPEQHNILQAALSFKGLPSVYQKVSEVGVETRPVLDVSQVLEARDYPKAPVRQEPQIVERGETYVPTGEAKTGEEWILESFKDPAQAQSVISLLRGDPVGQKFLSARSSPSSLARAFPSVYERIVRSAGERVVPALQGVLSSPDLKPEDVGKIRYYLERDPELRTILSGNVKVSEIPARARAALARVAELEFGRGVASKQLQEIRQSLPNYVVTGLASMLAGGAKGEEVVEVARRYLKSLGLPDQALPAVLALVQAEAALISYRERAQIERENRAFARQLRLIEFRERLHDQLARAREAARQRAQSEGIDLSQTAEPRLIRTRSGAIRAVIPGVGVLPPDEVPKVIKQLVDSGELTKEEGRQILVALGMGRRAAVLDAPHPILSREPTRSLIDMHTVLSTSALGAGKVSLGDVKTRQDIEDELRRRASRGDRAASEYLRGLSAEPGPRGAPPAPRQETVPRPQPGPTPPPRPTARAMEKIRGRQAPSVDPMEVVRWVVGTAIREVSPLSTRPDRERVRSRAREILTAFLSRRGDQFRNVDMFRLLEQALRERGL